MLALLTQSVDGPYVLVDLDDAAVDFLRRMRDLIRADADGLGLEGLVVRPPPGLTARYASRLTSASVAGRKRLFRDPLNEDGPGFLPGYVLKRVHVSADSFWLYAVDATDPTHVPEVNRSDAIAFAELGP